MISEADRAEVLYDDGEIDEERALSQLLRDDVLFANERETLHESKTAGSTVVPYAKCSDLFYWGCADAECLPYSEIGNPWRMHAADPVNGSSKWCCHRRKLRPQAPIVRDWKAAGLWDDALEALPSPPVS